MALTIDRCAAAAEVLAGGPEVLELLAPEWSRLCSAGAWNDDPFCRPEWSIAYMHAYEVKPRVLAVTARLDGRLSAVLPLMRTRNLFWGVPVRMLRQPADTARFDLALSSEEIEASAAIKALWHCLREDTSWDVIELAKVPQSAAVWRLMAEAERDGFLTAFQRSFRTPILSLTGFEAGGEDPWLAQTSPRFRHELRRKTRRLQAQGNLRLERFNPATPETLERFYELERSTWKGEQGCAVLSNRCRLRYYNEIARALERLGYLTSYFLTLDDRLIAGNMCLACGGKLFGLRCAFDPDFSPYSPGHILINWVLRDCAARHISELHFMGQAFDYKLQWTSHTVEHGYCYIFRRGLFGRALHGLKFWAVPLGRKLFHKPLPDW
jgi:CelD/BcsL family acetyltransferase involved in cellulose biosynthesis